MNTDKRIWTLPGNTPSEIVGLIYRAPKCTRPCGNYSCREDKLCSKCIRKALTPKPIEPCLDCGCTDKKKRHKNSHKLTGFSVRCKSCIKRRLKEHHGERLNRRKEREEEILKRREFRG